MIVMLLLALEQNAQSFLDVHPTYNKSGLFFNGFRLRDKEKVYTNTFLLINSFGFGVKDFAEVHIGATFLPLIGEQSSGVLPLLTFIPRLGHDFGKYHHISAGLIVALGGKNLLMNRQIAYTFGSRRNHIGVLYSQNEIFMEDRETWYLQYHFFPFKKVSIGAEHLIWSTYQKDSSPLLYHASNNHDPLMPSNFVGRIHFTPRFTFSLGYFTDYTSYSEDGILYLSGTFRINKEKPVEKEE